MTNWNSEDDQLLHDAFVKEAFSPSEDESEVERLERERLAFAYTAYKWQVEAKRNRRAFKLATLVAAILGSWALIVMGIWAVLR